LNKIGLPGVERIYTNRGNKLFQLKRYEMPLPISARLSPYIRVMILSTAIVQRMITFWGEYQEVLRL